jgi:hypothetical protein
MAEQSSMTIERGLGENIILTLQNLIHEQTGFTTAVNAWHSKRDNSWNINIYRTDCKKGAKQSLFDVGKGWDFVDAVEKLREHYLLWASAELELDEVAKNTFEIQTILDERSGNRRNDVGAVENDVPTTEELLSEIGDLKQKFEDILTQLKSLK